jgi:hypothetical protein
MDTVSKPLSPTASSARYHISEAPARWLPFKGTFAYLKNSAPVSRSSVFNGLPGADTWGDCLLSSNRFREADWQKTTKFRRSCPASTDLASPPTERRL